MKKHVIKVKRVGRAVATGEVRSASVGLRILPSLKAALAELASAESRTLNFYIESLLAAHVAMQEQVSKSRRKGKKAA